ncbi:hypothetical protein AB4400_29280, partial [Vibrio sp. 10N.261.48.A2]
MPIEAAFKAVPMTGSFLRAPLPPFITFSPAEDHGLAPLATLFTGFVADFVNNPVEVVLRA